jgi:hypothetical protein
VVNPLVMLALMTGVTTKTGKATLVLALFQHVEMAAVMNVLNVIGAMGLGLERRKNEIY